MIASGSLVVPDSSPQVVLDAQASSASLKAKYGYLSATERRALLDQKAEVSAERWVKDLENTLDANYPDLNPHFVDKHGPDIPLRPNLEGRAINGAHPRTGVTRGRRPRPQVSSQFNDWKTQMHVLNEATTREARGLPRYNAVDTQGNPAVKGTYPGGVGRGFVPNRQDPLNPIFNTSLENWLIRFDSTTNMPFTGYPTR